MSSVFLTAEWRNLILLTFEVPHEVLIPHLPAGIELDTIEGKAFVSLVAFDFVNTKVKGVTIPSHVNFPEINLRFYVKEKESGRRGVVFIREFVPKFLISFVADKIYNEPYKSIPMKSSVVKNGSIKVTHEVEFNEEIYHIALEAENKPYLPDENSIEHFFKEHSWGYGKSKKGETMVYEVKHPFWNVYPVKEYQTNFEFGRIYGDEWKFLNTVKPFNVMLAEGSGITVYSNSTL